MASGAGIHQRPEARIAFLEAQLAAEREELAAERQRNSQLRAEIEKLRGAYGQLREEVELLRRRIFVAKAERIDTRQLELEFAQKLADLAILRGRLPADAATLADDIDAVVDAAGTSAPPGGRKNSKHKPKGRRNLAECNLPERRVEILDPVFEQLVQEGKASRVSFQVSYRLGYERGGHRKIVIARATYRTEESDGTSAFATADLPPQTFPRAMAAPSQLAHVIHQKFGMGLPFFRVEGECRRLGVPIDRGSLCRWAEEVGSTLGSTVVEAMRREALATAFCIATDATGIAVLPPPNEAGSRQPCKRGHFFVQLADLDHIFFEYTDKETTEAVLKLFEGYRGYVQADAKSVFHALYRPRVGESDDDDAAAAKEVGCLAHCRRKFWEAAVTLKSVAAREGLYRIKRIYDIEGELRALSAEERCRIRNERMRPELDAFFDWAQENYEVEKNTRGLLRRAFGYAVRHRSALMRFLDDGRLRIDNNESERNLRTIAVGRKAWLFVGSDDHGVATGNILSLIASARLHGLDPEQYLRDIIRVLCHWPRERYLELAPKYWATTCARLRPGQLVAEYGRLDLPAAIAAPEQQALSR